MAKSNLTISFKAVDADGEALSVVLDAEKHIDVYGTAKSEFRYGEDVWLKIYPEPIDLALEPLKSSGNVTADGSGYEDVKDRITFAYALEGSLSKLPKDVDALSFTWFGADPGTPVIENKKLVFASEKVAVCDVEYSTFFKRFKLSGITEKDVAEFPVIIVFKGGVDE